MRQLEKLKNYFKNKKSIWISILKSCLAEKNTQKIYKIKKKYVK